MTYNDWFDFSCHCKEARDGTVVVIGNFDGCHMGHQHLIKRAGDYAQSHHLPLLALTFQPHPRVFFGKSKPGSFVFTVPSQKDRALKELGVAMHLSQQFTADFAGLSAGEFIKTVLVKALYAKAVFVGENFCFGKDRGGSATDLKASLESCGVFCEMVSSVMFSDAWRVSSSMVRRLMAAGDMSELKEALCRPLLYEGTCVKGQGLGKQLGYATMNLAISADYPLKDGVYTAFVSFDEKCQIFAYKKASLGWPAVVNKGLRPTLMPSLGGKKGVKNGARWLEAHILDFPSVSDARNIGGVGHNVGVYFMDFLRPEQCFSDVDALAHQLSQDVERARLLHQSYDEEVLKNKLP